MAGDARGFGGSRLRDGGAAAAPLAAPPAAAPASPWATLQATLKATALFVAALWAIEIVDTILLGSSLQRHGIRPRSGDGLWGILTAPLLHGGFGHLASNSAPAWLLGALVMLQGRGLFAFVTAVVVVLGGLATWAVGGAGTNHIGASGLIFGWFGFSVAAALLHRSWLALAGAAIAIGLYGGIAWGVLPGQPGVSWESHLFGALAGVAAARWSRPGADPRLPHDRGGRRR